VRSEGIRGIVGRALCREGQTGLALGKGVLICSNVDEADEAIDEILARKSFGAAGGKIVIQEFLEGRRSRFTRCAMGRRQNCFPRRRIISER